jgi:molybdopterin synthase catalytic subunit
LPVADLAVAPRVALVDNAIDVAALYASVVSPSVGAVSMFLGTVRDLNDGRPVTGIEYEAYRPMAQSELERIVGEVKQATDGLTVAVVHRLGTLQVGEISVAIVAAHPRRTAAIRSAERIIEEIKQRVPIWKLEHYVDGERQWVDPTTAVR